MKIGYIGLGKMGNNMVLRLLEQGIEILAWNRSPQPAAEVKTAGAEVADSVPQLVAQLATPRTIWLMLPAGEVTSQMISQLSKLLKPGDTIIDGANSNFNDTKHHAELLKAKGIQFLDAGVSGGPSGARHGACVMVGGDETQFKTLEPLFQAIAAPQAYRFFPGHGAGHFVKMVHNGIEYGMMQAIGEGFGVLQASPYNLDLTQVAEIYNQGSVIESRLIGWLHSGFTTYGPELAEISGSVKHSGEGQWTVETAKTLNIPTPIIEGSLNFRIASQTYPSYIGKIVSVLRNQFGGHTVAATEHE